MQDTQGRDKQDNRIIVNSVQNEEIQSFLVRNKQYKIFTIKDDIVLKATLNLPKIIEGSIPIDTQRQIFYHSSKDIGNYSYNTLKTMKLYVYLGLHKFNREYRIKCPSS